MAIEANFDALVGPSHHFGGLAYGNRASMEHAAAVSNPRAAALQGLAKARRVARLGIPQGLLPPQTRPRLDWLRTLGFEGTDAQVLESAARHAPRLLSAAWSASSMWAANAATISPSSDTDDGRLHVTPANLTSGLHRHLESAETTELLRQALAPLGAIVHPPLPGCVPLRDEGAANHVRLIAGDFGGPGLELFVHGDDDAGAATAAADRPLRYPARQTAEACRAIARRHRLSDGSWLAVRQHPAAIDAGVFHNDVVSVGHRDLLMLHERAFVDGARSLDEIARAFDRRCGGALRVVRFEEGELALDDAVRSYLFNCQWLTLPDGRWQLIVPRQCDRIPSAARAIERLRSELPELTDVHVVDLEESMANGGGPACLRLRVVLDDAQVASFDQVGRLTETRAERLEALIMSRYRDRLTFDDLRDPAFAIESLEIVAAIRELLGFRSALSASD